MKPDLTIGVSSCLLGAPVRYDGGHKRHILVLEELGARALLVPVCPEVELGLGTPRETLTLVREASDLRLILANGHDYTSAMTDYAKARVDRLRGEGLDGYVLKSRSPSCGLGDAAVRDRDGAMVGSGNGLFAEALLTHWPDLPVVTEAMLPDRAACETFLTRVAAYHAGRTRRRTP